MNPADVIVIAVIVCAVILAIRHIIRNKKAEGAAAADVAAATAATGVCTATVNAPPGNPETVGLKILSQPQLANHTLLSFENLKKVRENKKLS